MFVTGNNGTCIPTVIVNGVWELKGGAAAEWSFSHIKNMTKYCGEKLEFETLASTSKFIHSFQECDEFQKVCEGDVDPFQYICSQRFGIFLALLYYVSKVDHGVDLNALRNIKFDSAEQYPLLLTEEIFVNLVEVLLRT